jgi:hypothetical protein
MKAFSAYDSRKIFDGSAGAILDSRIKVSQPETNLQTSSSLFHRILAAIVQVMLKGSSIP